MSRQCLELASYARMVAIHSHFMAMNAFHTAVQSMSGEILAAHAYQIANDSQWIAIQAQWLEEQAIIHSFPMQPHLVSTHAHFLASHAEAVMLAIQHINTEYYPLPAITDVESDLLSNPKDIVPNIQLDELINAITPEWFSCKV